MSAVPFLVSIGSTHPWNIAGVGVDARVAAEYGLPHAVAIAGVTAQDAQGVQALQPIPAAIVRAQMNALPAPVGAYRIGALLSPEAARAVAGALRERTGGAPIVVDPVLEATLGGALQARAGLLQAIRAELLPLATIVTPNLAEAEALSELRVDDEAAMARAGERLVELGAAAALLTGGHLEGDPIDVLVTADRLERFAAPRLAGTMRGSGCTLAAALACELARGAAIDDAVRNARAYVRAKIAARTMRAGLQVAF